jgi:formylglycine-generating enzyme required for sulfatase activity
MKTKDILAMALLPVFGALAACSNDDAKTADNRVPITLTASTLTIEETRAAADTALNKGYLESGQAVRVRVRNTGSTGSWTDYAYTSGANGVLTAPATPPFYPINNVNVDIAAFCPYAAGETFTIHADQTSPEDYLASDLLFASVSNQEKTATAVPLQFEHKMAKVIITATAGSGVNTIEEVTLHKVLPSVAFNQSTGEVSTAIGNETDVILVKENNTSAVAGAAVIPAQAINGDILTIKTDQGTATYSVSSKVFTAGRVYKLTISVSKTSVNTTTAITNWTDTEGVVIKTGDDNMKMFFLESAGFPTHRTTFIMIKVEGGTYSTFGGVAVNGTISDFYIGQTEVTNFMWWQIMDNTRPSGQKNDANSYPVAMVTYAQIQTFISRLNTKLADQLDGMHFKLPSDAQWEYAARSGKYHDTYIYAGSNTLNYCSWNKNNSNNTTHPVAYDRACNNLGIYDMSGNLWEYCEDYGSSSIPTTQNDYVNTTPSAYRIIRGGCYSASQDAYHSVSYRHNLDVNAVAKDNVGFRLVLQ